MRELATQRLLLRGFTPDDVEAVHAYAGDPEVCRFTDWGPNTLAQSQAFIARCSPPPLPSSPTL